MVCVGKWSTFVFRESHFHSDLHIITSPGVYTGVGCHLLLFGPQKPILNMITENLDREFQNL